MNIRTLALCCAVAVMAAMTVACSRSHALESAMSSARDDVLPQTIIDGIEIVDLTYDHQRQQAMYHLRINEAIYGTDILTVYKQATGAATDIVTGPLAHYTGPLRDVVDETLDLGCPVALCLHGSVSRDSLALVMTPDDFARRVGGK